MAVPVLGTPGAAVASTGTSLDIPYPATISSGDLLLIHHGIQHTPGLLTLPAEWTLEATQNQADCTCTVYSKVADGTETGNLSVTGIFNFDTPKMARMHVVTGGASIESVGSSGGTNKTVGHPSITTTGADRLVLTFTAINDDETAASFTGETGGDLTLTYNDTTALGTDFGLSVQEDDLVSSGTISGGTWSYNGATEDWATIGLAVFAGSTGTTFFKTIAVTRTRAAVASTIVTFAKTIATMRTRAVALAKMTAKALSLTRTRTAVPIKQTSKTFTTTRTRSAAVSTAILFTKLLTFTRTRTTAIIKSTGKTIGVTRTRTAGLAKMAGKVIAVTRTRTAALSTVFTQTITIAVTRTRTAAADAVKLATQLISVTRTRTSTVAPVPTFATVISVTRTRTATLTKMISKTFAVTRTRAAATVKKTLKTFSLTRTRAAIATPALLASQLISTTRTRAIAATQVFIAGGAGPLFTFWRRFRGWRRHR